MAEDEAEVLANETLPPVPSGVLRRMLVEEVREDTVSCRFLDQYETFPISALGSPTPPPKPGDFVLVMTDGSTDLERA